MYNFLRNHCRKFIIFTLVCVVALSSILIAKLSTDYSIKFTKESDNIFEASDLEIEFDDFVSIRQAFENSLIDDGIVVANKQVDNGIVVDQDFYLFFTEVVDFINNSNNLGYNELLEFFQSSRYGEYYNINFDNIQARLGNGEWYIYNSTIVTIMSIVFNMAVASVKAAAISGFISVSLIKAYIGAICGLLAAIPILIPVVAFILGAVTIFAGFCISALVQSKGLAIKYTLWIIPKQIYVR